MPDSSVRGWLKTQLTPLLPDGWKISEFQRMPETIATTTLVLKLLKITPLPEAPRDLLANEVTLTIVSKLTDDAKAEAALDDAVLELVHALDDIDGLYWTTAEKVSVADTYLGWDISLTVHSKKKES